ncbi:unnamed protein product, partial [Timema podura]|nr:unnamed protein product [Timema podura]
MGTLILSPLDHRGDVGMMMMQSGMVVCMLLPAALATAARMKLAAVSCLHPQCR